MFAASFHCSMCYVDNLMQRQVKQKMRLGRFLFSAMCSHAAAFMHPSAGVSRVPQRSLIGWQQHKLVDSRWPADGFSPSPMIIPTGFGTNVVDSKPVSGSTGARGSPILSTMFDRENEREQLEALLSRSPRSLTVILGPRSCGKSRLLREYMEKKRLNDSICYVNCRTFDAKTPSTFATAFLRSGIPPLLKKLPLSAGDVMKRFQNFMRGAAESFAFSDKFSLLDPGSGQVGVKVEPVKIVNACLELLKPTARVPISAGLNDVIDCYQSLFEDWKENEKLNGTWPIIIIDEANELTAWPEGDRRTLLNFFVAITKELQMCHVLLVTSDYGFQEWLGNSIGAGFVTTRVIGDFPENEARVYLSVCLDNESNITDDDWARIYEVCGGNAGALSGAATEYSRVKSWTEALGIIWRPTQSDINQAKDGSDQWSALQYAGAALVILDAKYNVVTMEEMKAQLGRYLTDSVNEEEVKALGKPALTTLVAANRLALRPYSGWAHDIPIEAHGPQEDIIMTAPTASDLYCWRKMEEKFRATVTMWEQQQQQASSLSVASSANSLVVTSASPLAAELSEVTGDIKMMDNRIDAVEQEIDAVVREIKETGSRKEEGWQEQMAALRKREEQLREEKKQLREEKKQLREEKKQLRDKELLLLKRAG